MAATTPSHLRRLTPRTQLTDTPTPASSSAHSSLLITSLKPARSRSNMSHEYRDSVRSKQPAQPFTHTKSFQSAAPTALHRAPLGHHSGRSLNLPPLSDADDLDNLEIATDGTERQRRTLEEEIRRGMGELNLPQPQLGSPHGSAASLGFGDLSDAEEQQKSHNPFQSFRARMEDPSESSGSESLGDDFSLRLGMASQRAKANGFPDPLSEEDEPHSDGDLTYLTLDRTVASPPRAAPPPATKSTQSPNAPQQSAFPLRPVFGGSRPIFGEIGNRTSPVVVNAAGKKSTTVPAAARPSAPRFASPAADASRIRLPDVTGLTEGLASPERARGHRAVPDAAVLAEGAALSGALDTLKTRLSDLERENALSSARVRELEAKAGEDAQRRPPTPPVGGADWERKLADEQGRREALEALVSRLKSHVTHLTHSLQDHSATLAALRTVPAASPKQPQRRDQASHAVDLSNDVAALRAGLDGLGVEVDAVKQVVNDLVKERDAGRRWDQEEEARRAEMASTAPVAEGLHRRGAASAREAEQMNQDPDRTPRPPRRTNQWTGPDTPHSERSFLSPAEIERVQHDLLREQALRSSPSPRSRRPSAMRPDKNDQRNHHQHQHPHFEIPKRPATAPLPSRSGPAPPTHRRATYEPSNAYTEGDSPPRQRHQPKHESQSNFRTPAETRQQTTDDEMYETLKRADNLFNSVSAPKADPGMCTVCRRRRKEEKTVPRSAPPVMQRHARYEPEPEYDAGDESVENETTSRPQMNRARSAKKEKRQDPRIALENVLKDLEADFELHKRIYVELSDQYRAMDSRVEGGKRRTLAEHLKESIDTLELKAEQVQRLHDVLHYSEPASVPMAGRMREGII